MLAVALCFCTVVASCPGIPTELSVLAAQRQGDNTATPGEGTEENDVTVPGEGIEGDHATVQGEGTDGNDANEPGKGTAGDDTTESGEDGSGDDVTVPQEGGAEDSHRTPGNGGADENVELPDDGENTQAAPSADAAAESVMTGWHFGEDTVYPQGDLFYEEGVYRLVLAGGSSEVQIPLEEIVSLLPTSVTVEFQYDEVVLPVTGWSCSEYVCDAEGYLPYRGSFFFLAQLGEEAVDSFGEGTARIGVEVVFDEPMTLAEVTTAVPGTITSDQTWGAQTLSAGTYIINPGVTVTLTGQLTVSGNVNVTIKGGGTIVRDAGYIGETTANKASLFYVSSGTLTLENITVDGNLVNSNGPAIYTVGGTVNLQNGAVIQNNKNMNTHTTGRHAGGAVYCEGTLNINGGTIQNCSTREGGSGFSHAGGAYLQGVFFSGSFLQSCPALAWRRKSTSTL